MKKDSIDDLAPQAGLKRTVLSVMFLNRHMEKDKFYTNIELKDYLQYYNNTYNLGLVWSDVSAILSVLSKNGNIVTKPDDSSSHGTKTVKARTCHLKYDVLKGVWAKISRDRTRRKKQAKSQELKKVAKRIKLTPELPKEPIIPSRVTLKQIDEIRQMSEGTNFDNEKISMFVSVRPNIIADVIESGFNIDKYHEILELRKFESGIETPIPQTKFEDYMIKKLGVINSRLIDIQHRLGDNDK